MTTWFDGIENCPVCNAGLPSMRANDGWWGCEDCGFEVESAEQFQQRTGFVPHFFERTNAINEQYDAYLQQFQESQAGPQASHEEYEDFRRQVESERNRALDGEWLANQKPEIECVACGASVYSSGCPVCDPDYYER